MVIQLSSAVTAAASKLPISTPRSGNATRSVWEHPDGVSPLIAMEAVPAGGVRDDVNGRLGASRASDRTPARRNPKMGYQHVWGGYGRSGGFEVWRDVFVFNTREPVIMSLIAEICSPTFSHRSGLRTRSSSRWMRRRCRSAGRCMHSWSGATPTPSPSQHRNRTSCRERINKSDTRTQARPRNTGTEPRAGGTGAIAQPADAPSPSQHRNRTSCRG